MASFKCVVVKRDAKCRLCNGKINKMSWCFEMGDVHVSPKHVNLFFHEGCMSRAIEFANKNRNAPNRDRN